MKSARLALLVATLLALPSFGAAQTQPSYQIQSLFFGNFQVRTDDASKAQTGGKPMTQFDVARAYLTLRAPAGEKANIRLTTDIFQNPATGYYGGWAVRLKYAILHYDITKNLAGVEGLTSAARIGMLHTVVIEHVETFWPRWMGTTALENGGFFRSADVGAASLTTLPNNKGEVYATVMNGPGYTAPETDRFKDFAARFSWRPFGSDSGFLRTVTVTPWYYKGWLGSQFADPNPAEVGQVSDGLQRDRMGIFVGVRDRRLTLGAEYAQRLEEVEGGLNTVASPRTVTDRTSELRSVFLLTRPAELFDASRRSRFGLIGRFDSFQLNKDVDATNEFVVLGATWDLNSRVTVALDYQGLTPTGSANTANRTRTWFMHWTAAF